MKKILSLTALFVLGVVLFPTLGLAADTSINLYYDAAGTEKVEDVIEIDLLDQESQEITFYLKSNPTDLSNIDYQVGYATPSYITIEEDVDYSLSQDYVANKYTIKLDSNAVGKTNKITFTLTDNSDYSTVATKEITLVVTDSVVAREDAIGEADATEIIDKINKNELTTLIGSSASVLPQNVFEALKNNADKTLAFMDLSLKYGWAFIGSDILKTDIDLPLGITISKDKPDFIKNTINTNSLFLTFDYHGQLPGKANIYVDVENVYSNGTKLYLYYYNETTKKIELVAKDLEVTDNGVEFDIEHCSTYFLSDKDINVNPQTGDIPLVTLMTIAVISIVGISYSLKKCLN